MRFVKVFGLAILAAMAAMSFVGAGTASAQEHEITLCKVLEELCKPGNLWPAGTLLEALAKNPELTTGIFGTVKCEDSIVTGLATEAVANPYKFDEIKAVFGVLPTPTLGLGCTGCAGATKDFIHPEIEALQILVEKPDKYFLLGIGLALIKGCPLVGDCVYRGEHIKVPIAHDGTHPGMEGTNLALAKFEVTLNRATTHKAGNGNAACPATAEWKATYVLLKANDDKGNIGLAWPSLDKK